MRTAGEILREARVKKGFSLEEVEKATKIRINVLKALEESRWSEFPPTFTKGLLKNYGEFLGIEERKILAFFRREYDEKKAPIVSKPSKPKKTGLQITPQITTAFLLGIVVVAILSYLFIQYQSFTAAPKLEVQEPKNNTKISSLETTVTGQTWSDVQLKINGQEVQVSLGGSFSVSVGLKVGINTLTITASNQFGKTSTVTRSIAVNIPERNLEATKEGIALSIDLEIIKKSTFIEISIDGSQTFQGLMLVGSKKTFTAKQKIKIKTQNGASTKVTIDGRESILGGEGETVEREYGI